MTVDFKPVPMAMEFKRDGHSKPIFKGRCISFGLGKSRWSALRCPQRLALVQILKNIELGCTELDPFVVILHSSVSSRSIGSNSLIVALENIMVLSHPKVGFIDKGFKNRSGDVGTVSIESPKSDYWYIWDYT